jgi:hypothetical protein
MPAGIPFVGDNAGYVMSEAAGTREYQDRARECVQVAGTIADPGYKLFILEMAQAWVKLAKADGGRATAAVQANPAPPADALRAADVSPPCPGASHQDNHRQES